MKLLIRNGRIADGTQMSDVTPEKIDHHLERLRKGLAERATPAEDFRIGNFWAWHIKEDREKSMYEARRADFRVRAVRLRLSVRSQEPDRDAVPPADLVRAAWRDGLPRGWVKRMKASIRTIAPRFCATRMLDEYVSRIYRADAPAG